MIKYELWTEQTTLDSYRLNYCPREDYCLAGLWPYLLVTGKSGKRYHGMRGFDEVAKGWARTYCFMELNENNLDDFSKELYPDLLYLDQMEEYKYSESGDKVHFVGENIRLDIHARGYDWYDARGKFEIHAELLGQAVTFWVPMQEGLVAPIHHRSEMGRVTGQINGDPVEGFTGWDSSYTHPGVLYFHLPLIQKLEKEWAMWFVEYTDGGIDAGFAWKGRLDTGFAAGHLLRDGKSTAVPETRVIPTYTERGVVQKTRVEIAGEWFELEQDTCSDWPTHTFGKVVATSRGREIARSWNYIEWFPDNTEELLEIYLSGKIKVEDSKLARIENECMTFPEHIMKSE